MRQVEINNKQRTLLWLTGTVAGAQKNFGNEVHVSGGGGYVHQGSGFVNPVHVHSESIAHDRIFIYDHKGNEYDIKLRNWDVGCREGHLVTLVWLDRSENKRGSFITVNHTGNNDNYLAIRNHTTGKTIYNSELITKMSRFNWILVCIIATCVCYVPGIFLFGKGHTMVAVTGFMCGLWIWQRSWNNKIYRRWESEINTILNTNKN